MLINKNMRNFIKFLFREWVNTAWHKSFKTAEKISFVASIIIPLAIKIFFKFSETVETVLELFSIVRLGRTRNCPVRQPVLSRRRG